MARIYYHEEKLSGQAFESSVINVQLFDFIFDNTNAHKFEMQAVSSGSFMGLSKSAEETFKTVIISRDGISYKSTEGSFYLPKAIIFYDHGDYSFPSEFYFLAKLGDKIEIRKCNGGKEVKWFQIPDLHQETTDATIISKIENTLLEVEKLVKTTHNKQIDSDREKKKQEEKRRIEENRTYLNDTQKNAYKALAEMCLIFNPKREYVIEFMGNLKNYDQESEYYTTLNYVMDFLDDHEISFILRLDWKAGIDELEWVLKSSLKENYNLSLDLPSPNNYDKNASVSFDNVFEDFDQALQQNGLQMGFMDTQSDEYVFVLHKKADCEKVKITVNEIGYEYYTK